MSKIRLKMGYCPLCGNAKDKPIVGGLCQYHYWQTKKKPIERKPTKISPVSKSRAAALEKYRRLRDEYFKEHPICEFPGCNSTKVTLHHMRGRIGSFLTNKKYFKSLCWPHHRYVEDHPSEAKKLGLSLKKLES